MDARTDPNMPRHRRYQQHMSSYENAEMARIEQRTFGLEQNFKDLSNDVAAVDAKFSSQLTNMDARFSSQLNSVSQSLSLQLSAVSAKMDERAKPQWMLLIALGGILITFMTVIGGLAYAPIRSTSDRLEAEVIRLRDTTVTSKEVGRVHVDVSALEGRTKEMFRRVEKELDELRTRGNMPRQ